MVSEQGSQIPLVGFGAKNIFVKADLLIEIGYAVDCNSGIGDFLAALALEDKEEKGGLVLEIVALWDMQLGEELHESLPFGPWDPVVVLFLMVGLELGKVEGTKSSHDLLNAHICL